MINVFIFRIIENLNDLLDNCNVCNRLYSSGNLLLYMYKIDLYYKMFLFF